MLCWSAQAKVSEYVQFEYARAEGLGKHVMPWLLDDTPLPAMVEIQAIASSDVSVVAAALATAIGWNLTRRRWLAGVTSAALGATVLAIWQRPRSFELEGVVTDTDNLPLAGVLVGIDNNSAKTDTLGRFTIRLHGTRPAWVTLQFTKDGYQPESRNAATGEVFRMALVRRRN